MSRFLSVCLLCSLLFLFTGCGSEPDPGKPLTKEELKAKGFTNPEEHGTQNQESNISQQDNNPAGTSSTPGSTANETITDTSAGSTNSQSSPSTPDGN